MNERPKTLPYKETVVCQHITCKKDMETLGNGNLKIPAIVWTKMLGYLCDEHGMLALIAGLKPEPLPEPDESIKTMMEMLE